MNPQLEIAPMIEQLIGLGADSSDEPELMAALWAHAEAVQRSTRAEGARRVVDAADNAVRQDVQGAITFAGDGTATVRVPDHTWHAGRFFTPTLGSLERWAREAPFAVGSPRLWVLWGEHPMTDIGAMQAFAPPGTLFQVASQFNCLESPGSYVTPVQRYLTDPTQGPRASVSALPGTLVRHYAAPCPDGRRFTQSTRGEQVNLLGGLLSPGVAEVHSGYLRDVDVTDPVRFARVLEDNFEELRVGVQDDVQVVLGANWAGEVPPCVRVSQVFTSTLAAGGYGRGTLNPAELERICGLLLRGAYFATLLAARALGRRRVVLTLIGGGVFANPIRLIWESILWAIEELAHQAPGPLDVLVNGRNLAHHVPPEELALAARSRGGVALELTGDRISVLR